MLVVVKSLNGRTWNLDVEPDDTVASIRQRLADRLSVSITEFRLIYFGKQLENSRTLRNYDIQKESTLHMLEPRRDLGPLTQRPGRRRDGRFNPLGSLLAKRNATQATTEVPAPAPQIQQAMAPESLFQAARLSQFLGGTERTIKPDSFDSDLDIIDPINYQIHLESISNNVAARSEFMACGGNYIRFNQNEEIPTVALRNEPTSGSGNIPDWMRVAARHLPPNSPEQLQSVKGIMADLWKTCLIIDGVLSSIVELQQNGLCNTSFNVLVNYGDADIAELTRIECSEVEAIMQEVINILERFWIEDGILPAEIENLIQRSVFASCQGMVAVVLDLGLLSYTGSHGIRFDQDYLRTNTTSFKILWPNSVLTCRCSLKQLACLRGFLDGRGVWVISLRLRGSTSEQRDHQPASILTTIQEFADVWGPVFAIPNPVHPDKIQQYNVSKGIIHTDGRRSPIRNAVKCHWYNERSWKLRWQRMQRLGRPERHQPESLLSLDDVLLIGDTMIEKYQCQYTLNEFEESYGNMLIELGTRESEWRWDTRGASIGIDGSLRISIFGTQKRIPNTTQKQRIIDKWKSAPEQRNPHMLSLQLGVEVSHCTGNARRLAVKDLFKLKPVALRLDQQFPAWDLTDWGSHFKAAIEHDKDSNAALLEVWRNFEGQRSKIAALVTYVLDLLSPTGLDGSCFKVAFLNHGCEAMLNLSVEMNTWARLLKDTPNSAAFALIIEKCLECRLPNHIAPYCCRSGSPQSQTFTVLQTKILVPIDSVGKNRFTIMPVGERFRRVELGEAAALLLMSETKLRSVFSTIASLKDTTVAVVESSDPMRRWGSVKTIYIQASLESSGGMDSIRKITVPVGGELPTWPEVSQPVAPALIEYNNPDDVPGAQNSQQVRALESDRSKS